MRSLANTTERSGAAGRVPVARGLPRRRGPLGALAALLVDATKSSFVAG
jgi:hypothetical protein